MKKILVTGSGGYIGRHVVKRLLDKGYDVIAADLCNNGVDNRAMKMSVSVLSSIEDPYAFFGEPDICIHLAWRNGFVHNADSHIADLSAHFVFLKKLIDSGISGLAVMGTMHEVGYWEGAIDENTPCNPLSLYGISKNTLREALLRSGNAPYSGAIFNPFLEINSSTCSPNDLGIPVETLIIPVYFS